MAQIDPPEAKNIAPEARDPGKRWYGVYANYNSPAYNTKQVKASDLPKTYEEFAKHKEWAGKVAIDGTDNEWLKGMFEFYGEQKGTQLIKDIVATLKPIVTDGHLAMARATGAGEYAISLNNYVNLTMNVKLAGGPIDYFALDPVTLIFGQVGVSAQGAASECRAARGEFHAQPGMPAVPRQVRPPADARGRQGQPARHRRDAAARTRSSPTLLTPEEERKWQRTFETLFKGR